MPIKASRPWWGFIHCFFAGHDWYLPILPLAGPAPFKACRNCGARAKFVATIDGENGQHLPRGE